MARVEGKYLTSLTARIPRNYWVMIKKLMSGGWAGVNYRPAKVDFVEVVLLDGVDPGSVG